jgi:hypothetical protein
MEFILYYIYLSHGSAFSIATGYRLYDRVVGVSLFHMIQIIFGAHSASYSVLGPLSREVNWPGREADHSPPASTEVKKTWIYTYTPPYIFMA